MLAMLSLSACSDNNAKYPDEYLGFDKVNDSYTFDKQTEEKEIGIKIIAAQKSEKDREVKLTGKWKPGAQGVFRLIDTKVVIPAKKKSATARILVFPKRIKQSEEIRIICSPQDTEAKQTQLTLKLVAK